MRALLIAALSFVFIPRLASAEPYTLEEIGAMAPGQRSFTHSPLLELTGLPMGVGTIDPTETGSRGGGYEVQDVGNISLISGPWTYSSLSGNNIYATLNEFLGRHENEYDFVSIFVTEQLNFGAFYSPLQNDVRGLGAPPGTAETFDQTTSAGFGELEGYLFMNSIFGYLGSVRDALFFGQEVGHRWGAYVRRSGGGRDMLGRDNAHWNFYMESQNSSMEGNAWIEIEDGVFETDHMAEIGYSELDMYLMGFRDPRQVSDWFLIDDPQVLRNQVGWPTAFDSAPYYAVRAQVDEETAPELPAIRVRGNRVDIALRDVTDVQGERDPDFEDAQREFNMAFVIMMPEGEPVSFDEYLVVEDVAEELTALWEEMVDGEALLRHELGTSGSYDLSPAVFPDEPAWEPTFNEATETGLENDGCQTNVGGQATRGSSLVCLGLASVFLRRRRRGLGTS